MTSEENAYLAAHVIKLASESPRAARGLRDIIKKNMDRFAEGSAEYDQLLDTLQSLDLFIAHNGQGYSEEPLK